MCSALRRALVAATLVTAAVAWSPSLSPRAAVRTAAAAAAVPRGRPLHATPQTAGSGDDVVGAVIEQLRGCELYSMPTVVKQHIAVISQPQFFMALAARADENPADRDEYAALADNVVKTLEAVVAQGEERMDEQATTLETILRAAAEDDGEFLVPLSADKLAGLREAVAANYTAGLLDEAFLQMVASWMKKVKEDDGLGGMDELLQKVYQAYGAAAMRAPPASAAAPDGGAAAAAPDGAAEARLQELLDVDPDAWDEALAGMAERVDGAALLAAAQARVEGVVLNQPNGSMQQRVQAEFMGELMRRIQATVQVAAPAPAPE